MRRNHRAALAAVVPGGIFLAAILVAGAAGYRLNLTPSMPLGIWRAADYLHRGAFVTACLPASLPGVELAYARQYLPRGSCDSGYAPVLKKIAAIPGDVVQLDAAGIRVNGIALEHTSPNLYDSQGRAMPRLSPGRYSVKSGQYWIIGTGHPNSFDSRYFGPVDRRIFLRTMQPVLTLAQHYSAQ